MAVLEANLDVLFLSNPFIGESAAPQNITAEQIYKLIKNGSFGYGRKQISDTFLAAGGKNAAGQPESIKNIIALCL
ncbi:MAG: hypothetical protein K2X27_13645, partial [Candidatus Obscuribacterales bacterium]|nr:hypothetical protein [Candidatus Obscuribacterales bacterium]